MAKHNDAELAAMDAFALATFGEMASRATPILERKLAEAGVTDIKELSQERAGQLLKESLTESAVAHFPDTDHAFMARGLDAFFNPTFTDAFSTARRLLEEKRGAFDPATGPAIATTLAGLGVEVAPLDKKTMRRLAEPTRDFRTAANTFARFKSAFVGYNSATAPFYAVCTDDHTSLNQLLASHHALAGMKQAAERVHYDYRPGMKPFQHSVLLLPRHEGDEFDSAYIEDPRLDRGSVLAPAGWQASETTFGVENDGWVPMMLQVVDVMLRTPAVLTWLNPSDRPSPVMN